MYLPESFTCLNSEIIIELKFVASIFSSDVYRNTYSNCLIISKTRIISIAYIVTLQPTAYTVFRITSLCFLIPSFLIREHTCRIYNIIGFLYKKGCLRIYWGRRSKANYNFGKLIIILNVYNTNKTLKNGKGRNLANVHVEWQKNFKMIWLVL